ncbi:DedA family protein [Salinigranum marinum]|uniref:DedA family protein n=1 Tax=Salinigranum marinum TaxID=1515595 RepID=UPI002989BB7D|nr:VTT domain-containing protein [Salinigranum marinum]
MELSRVALGLVRLYGPLAVCLFVFLETSMLFPLLPSEVVVPAAAAVLVTDFPSFLVFVLAGVVGGTAGAFVPFVVFSDPRIGATGWLEDRIAVSEEQIERGQRWFRRWGEPSVLWGRFLPVFRSAISIPAGLARMDPTRFGVFTAVGTAGFYAATGGLVYYGRRQSLGAAVVAVATDRPGLTAVGILVLLGIALVVGGLSRRLNQ